MKSSNFANPFNPLTPESNLPVLDANGVAVFLPKGDYSERILALMDCYQAARAEIRKLQLNDPMRAVEAAVNHSSKEVLDLLYEPH